MPVVDVWMDWSDRAVTQSWRADTGAMVFSVTKGVASAVIHRLANRGLLSYDDPVAEYWPEFAANGKGGITVRWMSPAIRFTTTSTRYMRGYQALNRFNRASVVEDGIGESVISPPTMPNLLVRGDRQRVSRCRSPKAIGLSARAIAPVRIPTFQWILARLAHQ